MSLLILTRLQPGEQSGIIPIEPFQRFPETCFKGERSKSEPLKRLGKKIRQPVHLVKAR